MGTETLLLSDQIHKTGELILIDTPVSEVGYRDMKANDVALIAEVNIESPYLLSQTQALTEIVFEQVDTAEIALPNVDGLTKKQTVAEIAKVVVEDLILKKSAQAAATASKLEVNSVELGPVDANLIAEKDKKIARLQNALQEACVALETTSRNLQEEKLKVADRDRVIYKPVEGVSEFFHQARTVLAVGLNALKSSRIDRPIESIDV